MTITTSRMNAVTCIIQDIKKNRTIAHELLDSLNGIANDYHNYDSPTGLPVNDEEARHKMRLVIYGWLESLKHEGCIDPKEYES